MNNLKKYYGDKATLCTGTNCVTVYGDTARTINLIIVYAVIIAVIAYCAKALR